MCPEAFNVIKVVPVSFFFLFQCQPESNINCDYFVTNSTCIHFCKMNSKFTRVIKEHFLRKRVIFWFFFLKKKGLQRFGTTVHSHFKHSFFGSSHWKILQGKKVITKLKPSTHKRNPFCLLSVKRQEGILIQHNWEQESRLCYVIRPSKIT